MDWDKKRLKKNSFKKIKFNILALRSRNLFNFVNTYACALTGALTQWVEKRQPFKKKSYVSISQVFSLRWMTREIKNQTGGKDFKWLWLAWHPSGVSLSCLWLANRGTTFWNHPHLVDSWTMRRPFPVVITNGRVWTQRCRSHWIPKRLAFPCCYF